MKALHKSLLDEILLGRCVVTPARVRELPSARISEFGSLLDDPTSVDVTFVVNNERIPAHRTILAARSTYFRTMFSSGMKEAQEGNDIIVQDTSPAAFRAMLLYLYTEGNDIIVQDTSPAAFRALLLYLYTDELAFDDSVELLVDVLCKAKELELTRVANYCEQPLA